jgi:hypothetical protein
VPLSTDLPPSWFLAALLRFTSHHTKPMTTSTMTIHMTMSTAIPSFGLHAVQP